MNASRLKSILQYVVSFLLAAGLLYWLYKGQDTDQIFKSLQSANYLWVAVSLVFTFLAHYIRAWRWVMTLAPAGYHVSQFNGFLGVMIGYLANLVVPRMGEVTRCAILNRTDATPVGVSFGTVIAERVFDLLALILIVTFAIFIEYDKIGDFVMGQLGGSSERVKNLVWLLPVGGVLLVIMLFAFSRWKHLLAQKPLYIKIMTFLNGIKDGLLSVSRLSRGQFVLYILQTIGIWVCYWLTAYTILLSVPETSALGLMASLTVMAMSSIAMVIPVQGGFGVVHAFVAFTLVAYGIDGGFGASFALLAHSSQVASIVFGGGFSLLALQFVKKKAVE